MKSSIPILLCIFILGSTSYSQTVEGTFYNSEPINESISVYNNYIGEEARVYNGRKYIPYIFLANGTPFFLSDTLSTGWISYNGHIYYSIPLKYDIARDQIVITNLDHNYLIFLQNELIDSFHFLDHTFKRLVKNLNPKIEHTGFYDLVYKGSVNIWALRNKRFSEKFQNNNIIRVFYSYDQYYIQKGNLFNHVKNENDVFEILGSKRSQIKKLMRREKVKFRRRNFEEALVMAVNFFDQIKN